MGIIVDCKLCAFLEQCERALLPTPAASCSHGSGAAAPSPGAPGAVVQSPPRSLAPPGCAHGRGRAGHGSARLRARHGTPGHHPDKPCTLSTLPPWQLCYSSLQIELAPFFFFCLFSVKWCIKVKRIHLASKCSVSRSIRHCITIPETDATAALFALILWYYLKIREKIL